jgi:hypothetical protein
MVSIRAQNDTVSALRDKTLCKIVTEQAGYEFFDSVAMVPLQH